MTLAELNRYKEQQNVQSLFILEIIRGLYVALISLCGEVVTFSYPFEKGPLSPRFRGEHALRRYTTGEEHVYSIIYF